MDNTDDALLIERPGRPTAELLAPYGEWAGLASLYLATAFKHGLIPLPAERPVRFPPPAYA